MGFYHVSHCHCWCLLLPLKALVCAGVICGSKGELLLVSLEECWERTGAWPYLEERGKKCLQTQVQLPLNVGSVCKVMFFLDVWKATMYRKTEENETCPLTQDYFFKLLNCYPALHLYMLQSLFYGTFLNSIFFYLPRKKLLLLKKGGKKKKEKQRKKKGKQTKGLPWVCFVSTSGKI